MFKKFFISLCLFSTYALAENIDTKNDIDQHQIYGTYNNGCIAKSVSLDLNSKDYQVQQWSKVPRHYGHPMMIEYLHDLMAKAKKAKLPNLLIGDISQINGGPLANSSHASHNIGLDVDIPFDFSSPRKSAQELRKPKDVYIVTSKSITKNFDEKRIKLIILAASDDRVQRIFVAPMIKKHMCDLFGADQRNDKWLSRLRPWFGHKAHMHVRLRCPDNSPYCKEQNAVPLGNGCGEELASWFKPPENNVTTTPKAKPKKVLPEQCVNILSQK